MKIRQVMTEGVSYVAPETPIVEVARRMREDEIGSVPVAENDRLIGMVTDRDVVLRVVAEGTQLNTCTARDAMSPGILYCFDDQNVAEILKNMGDRQIRRLPVVTREKRLVGMVSLGDLSQAAKLKAGAALKEISRASGAPQMRDRVDQLRVS